MPDRPKHSFSYVVAAIVLVAVFATAMRRFLIGESFPIWDANGLFGPYYMLIADLARHGSLLWWNPWANGGQPDFADPQYGAHSPVVLLLAWLFGPTVRGFIAYWFSLWLLFGLGILALARQWKVPAWGGAVVALGLMFSGFFVGHAEHTPVLFSWVWMPMVLWRLEVALTRASWAAGAQAGVLFGLSALGGYPAILFTNGVFLVFWVAVRVFLRDKSEARDCAPADSRWAVVPPCLLMSLVAVVIALPTFFSLVHEGRGFTNRVGALPHELAVLSNALHPRALLTFASPYLSALPPTRLWDYTDISSCGLYVGGIVFAFAVFAILARPRSRMRWALLAAAAFAVTASLGRALPVRGWLYDWFLPMRYFRHPSWFRAYPMFLFGILALLGARDYVDGVPGVNCRRRLVAATTLSAIVALVAYLLVVTRVQPANRMLGDVHFLLAWVIPALVVPWLRPDSVAQKRVWVPVVFGLLAAIDAVLGTGLATTLGLTGEQPKRAWADVERHHRSETDLLRLDGAQRTLFPKTGRFDNKHFLTREAALYGESGLRNDYLEAWIREPVLVSAATTENRFWFAANPLRLSPSLVVLDAFIRRSRDLGKPLLLIHPRASMIEPTPFTTDDLQRIGQAPAAEPATVVLERYVPNAVRLRFEAPRDGWLMVTDRWAAGWVARVNDVPVAVEGADFLFRGLPVRAGPNRVDLVYRPPGRPWLPLVTWAFIAAVVVGSFWPFWSRRRRGEDAKPPAA
jgi:hypothetical protein